MQASAVLRCLVQLQDFFKFNFPLLSYEMGKIRDDTVQRGEIPNCEKS